MANRSDFTSIPVYIPQQYREHHLLERLQKLAQKRDRSMSYMVVKAILAYVEREEKKGP